MFIIVIATDQRGKSFSVTGTFANTDRSCFKQICFVLRRQGYDVRAMVVCRFDPMQNYYEIARVDETSLDELVMSILTEKK
jgi:hypothetical protein